jgi:hypothetical protein
MRVGAPGQEGTLTYLHGDHLGSTSLATNDQGGELYRRGYHSFGEERYAVGVAVTDCGFTGQREEANISWRGAQTAAQDVGSPFRDVLAADIWDVRSIVGSRHNEALLALIDYYRTNFPGLMAK